jgi:Associated with zinc fingers.
MLILGPTKYILKGLSPAFSPRDIQSELVVSGFEVIEVTNMVSWVTKRPLPIFKLILKSEVNSKHIEDVKQVGLHLIKIEPFHRNRCN